MSTFLTPHFTLEALTSVGPHLGLENDPDQQEYENLMLLAQVLEECRSALSAHFGTDTKVYVKYGLRQAPLNTACGGSMTSAHLEGLAADTHYDGHDSEEIGHILFQNPVMAKIDQLIIENGCLHIGLPCRASGYEPRHQLLHDGWKNGKRFYTLMSVWKEDHNG